MKPKTQAEVGEPAEPGGAVANGSRPLAAQGGTVGYLAFVIHEARSPLTTALWSAEMLTRLSPEDRAGARGPKLASMTFRSLQRLSRLLEDYFLAERLAGEGFALRLEVVSLTEAVAAAAAKAGIQGELRSMVPEGMSLRADPGMLGRALEGMLAWAGREASPVDVEAKDLDGGRVEVRVRGANVAPEALQRPSKGSASDQTGRALGLVAAAEVARAHGGKLAVDRGALVLDLPGMLPGK